MFHGIGSPFWLPFLNYRWRDSAPQSQRKVATLVPEKSVQYVAQFLASADLNCACARFCYSVSPWVTFQKFWNIKWIKICVYCYFNIFMLRRRILQRKRKFRRPLSSMWGLIVNCYLHFCSVTVQIKLISRAGIVKLYSRHSELVSFLVNFEFWGVPCTWHQLSLNYPTYVHVSRQQAPPATNHFGGREPVKCQEWKGVHIEIP